MAAWIDGEAVAYDQFEAYALEVMDEDPRDLDGAVLQALFTQFLDQRLLVHLAADRRLVSADAGPAAAAVALLEDEKRSPPSDSASGQERDQERDQEIAEYYRDHRVELELGERVRLNQVLLQDRGLAERIRGELVAGASFDEVADRYQSAEAVFVAARGELEREQVPSPLSEVIFGLAPGETGAVLEADYGFHVFQVVDRRPGELPPLEQLRSLIEERLDRQAADQRLADLLVEARSRYNLEVAERNLPFPYAPP